MKRTNDKKPLSNYEATDGCEMRIKLSTTEL